jgi:hypothetical protein
MNSVSFQRAIAWFPLVLACCGWPFASGSKADVLPGQQRTQAAAAHLREHAEEPPDHSGSAQALVAVHRKRYAAMSEAELNRHQGDVEARCRQLQRESDPVEKEYRRQLAALSESGQFSATAFGAIAAKRQALLQDWIQAVAEVAALPRFENDPLVQAILDAYLQEVGASKRLEVGLVALTVDDRLPDERAVRNAQDLLRAAEREREPRNNKATDSDSEAGTREHAETPQDGRAVRQPSKAKIGPAPACSARQRWSGPCKRRPRCGCRAGRAR